MIVIAKHALGSGAPTSRAKDFFSRSTLGALCLTALAGLGRTQGVQGVLDPKIPLPTRIDKSVPPVICPKLDFPTFVRRISVSQGGPVQLLGDAEMWTLGSRLQDAKPEELMAAPDRAINIRSKNTNFTVPLANTSDGDAEVATGFIPIKAADADKGINFTSFFSSTSAALVVKSALGDGAISGFTGRYETVDLNAGIAWGVMVREINEDRLVGKDGSGGPWSRINGRELTVVMRKFGMEKSTSSFSAKVLLPREFTTPSKEDLKDNQNPYTDGRLVLYFVGNDSGVTVTGSWAAARASLPPEVQEYIATVLPGLVGTRQLPEFFAQSIPLTQRFEEVGKDEYATQLPTSPVQANKLVGETGDILLFAAPRLNQAVGPTLGVLSGQGFDEKVVAELCKAVSKSKPISPTVATNAGNLGTALEIVTKFTSGGQPEVSYISNGNLYYPFYAAKPSPDCQLRSAVATALAIPAVQEGSLEMREIRQILALLSTQGPVKQSKGTPLVTFRLLDEPKPASNKRQANNVRK